MSEFSAKILIKGDDKKEIGRFVREIAFAIEAQMKLEQTEPKHGREYKRGNRSHTASAAGEAPAVDTGFLINSIHTRIISDKEAEIEINADYAEFLEVGTIHMGARPYVEPAIEGVIARFNKSGGILSNLRD